VIRLADGYLDILPYRNTLIVDQDLLRDRKHGKDILTRFGG
jgi:hypothetical protein